LRYERDTMDPRPGAGLFAYTKKSIDTPGESLAQVIISRDQRMLGMELGAEWVDSITSPHNVHSNQVVWSLNIAALKGERGLWATMAVIFLVSVSHEVGELYGECLTVAELIKRLLNPWLIFKAAVLVVPFLLQFISSLAVSLRVTVNSYIIVIMSLRFFIELQVLSPFRMVIAPVLYAMTQLGSVVVIVALMGLILAMLYGQLFGVFDSTLHLSTTGFAKIIKLLTSPPEMDADHMRQSLAGEVLLYYWATFIMRLVLGSFMVAVLVGAFNTVRGRIATEKTMRRALPADYVYRQKEGCRLELADALWYALTGRVNGAFLPLMYRKLKRLASTGTAVQCVAGRATHEFSQAQLAEYFGARSANFIVDRYGVLPPAGHIFGKPSELVAAEEGGEVKMDVDVIGGSPETAAAWGMGVDEVDESVTGQKVASMDKRLAALCTAHEQVASDLKSLIAALSSSGAPLKSRTTRRRRAKSGQESGTVTPEKERPPVATPTPAEAAGESATGSATEGGPAGRPLARRRKVNSNSDSTSAPTRSSPPSPPSPPSHQPPTLRGRGGGTP